MIHEIMFEEFRYIGELLAAGLLMALPAMERRNGFLKRLIFGGIFCFAFVFLYLILDKIIKNNEYIVAAVINVTWYTLVVFLFSGYLFLCFKVNFTELLWVTILAYSMQHFEYVLINELLFMGLARELAKNFLIYSSICVVSCAALYFIIYMIFKPYINCSEKLYLEDNRNSRILYVFLLILLVVSSMINQANTRLHSETINYLGVFPDIFNCLFILIVQYEGLKRTRVRSEKIVLEQLYHNSIKQHEAYKESVDYINVKCHDLKYQIKKMQDEGRLNSESLKDVEESIALYETFCETGNKTLDIILTDLHLSCKSKNILLSCMIDASDLNIMEDSDIYALFSNLVENSIEYVSKLSDSDKRYIRLTVKPVGNMLIIHQENYFFGNLKKTLDDIPITTKEDKLNHGFGIKSMRKIAQKYNGKLNVNIDGDLFILNIILPKIK